MSGKNVVQKILARAAERESVETGEYLIVRSNCPTPMQGDSLGRGNDQIQQMGAKLFDPAKVRIVVGKRMDNLKSTGDARRRVRRWAEDIHLGLPVIEVKGIMSATKTGDELEVDLAGGTVKNLTTRKTLTFIPYPDYILEILKAGGVYQHLKKMVQSGL